MWKLTGVVNEAEDIPSGDADIGERGKQEDESQESHAGGVTLTFWYALLFCRDSQYSGQSIAGKTTLVRPYSTSVLRTPGFQSITRSRVLPIGVQAVKSRVGASEIGARDENRDKNPIGRKLCRKINLAICARHKVARLHMETRAQPEVRWLQPPSVFLDLLGPND